MADEIVYVNVEEGLKRVMNNAKLYSNLLSKFKNYTHIGDIEAASAGGDAEKTLNIVHTLKGLAANLSLTELYKNVLEYESQLKAGVVNPDKLETIKKVFADTIVETDKVVEQYG